ncbi:ABC transporter permease [[Clostridium] cellulosi]
MKKERKTILNSPLMALPSQGLLLLMIIFPICLLILYSFSKGNITAGIPTSFSAANYKEMLTSPIFYKLMLKSIIIGLEVTVFCVVISAPAAWALAKAVKATRRSFGVMLIIIPFFTSHLLLIYSIMVVFESKGILMSLLGFLHLADPTESIVYTRPFVVILLVYEYLPYMILSLYSSFEQIDDALLAASSTLGAGTFTTLRKIVFPLSLPGLLTGILLVFVPAVGSFVEPAVAGGPNGMMIGSLIDSNFSMSLNMCYGAALSLAFLIILLILVTIINLIFKFLSRRVGGEV